MSAEYSTPLWTVPPEKRCGKCKKLKPLEAFGKVKSKSRSYCRECHSLANLKEDLRTEKHCACCGEVKPVADFNRCGNRYQSHCRKCGNERAAAVNRANKLSGQNIEINRKDYWKRAKWKNLKCKYGLKKEEYEGMLAAQNNVCAICERPERECDPVHGNLLQLSVDHDHKTGKVRGLLCRQCNIALGRFGEDVDVMMRAIEYLKKHKT